MLGQIMAAKFGEWLHDLHWLRSWVVMQKMPVIDKYNADKIGHQRYSGIFSVMQVLHELQKKMLM